MKVLYTNNKLCIHLECYLKRQFIMFEAGTDSEGAQHRTPAADRDIQDLSNTLQN